MLGIVCFIRAQTAIQSTAAIQVTKKCADSSTANIDNSFVRAETRLSAKPGENTGGLLHLRFELPVATKNIDITQVVRQAYWDLVVSMVNIRGGRWYSIYSPGAYFGKYLHGVNARGSGSMCTNYSVVDGTLVTARLEQYKSSISVGLLPQDFTFENIYTMIFAESKPIDPLLVKVAANLQVMTPGGAGAAHILMLNATYAILEDLNVFAEATTVNLSEAKDNTWVLAGLDIPTAKVLDKLRAEIEYKRKRLGDGNTDGDFAWMIVMVKKVKGLGFYVNVGADPKELGSASPGDIGGHLRLSADF